MRADCSRKSFIYSFYRSLEWCGLGKIMGAICIGAPLSCRVFPSYGVIQNHPPALGREVMQMEIVVALSVVAIIILASKI